MDQSIEYGVHMSKLIDENHVEESGRDEDDQDE